MRPEEAARAQIDAMLAASGWAVQDRARLNLGAGRGVAVREFSTRDGATDYLLFVDREAVGTVEAKRLGHTLIGVEEQGAKYGAGLPPGVRANRTPLPFAYETTGVETRFTSLLDPEPRSRAVFTFHRPETLADWLEECPADPTEGENLTLRARLRRLPPLPTEGLRDCQVEAVANLERSFAEDRPRALVQMATGSGKTYTAITAIYRLLKHGGAKKILFLVDRDNLGEQAENEFAEYVVPGDGRKFTELYPVQRLRRNRFEGAASIVEDLQAALVQFAAIADDLGVEELALVDD